VAIARWSARFDDRAIVFAGLGLLLSGVALLVATTSFWFGLLAVLPFAIGYGLVFPTLSSLASKLADDDFKGSILGGFLFLGGGGRVIGPVVAGLAFERVGIDLPMLLAAVSFALAAMVTLAVPRHVRGPSRA
jgi:MFS family permease